ncbi:MAG: hypothetical protein HYV09_37825 [Deltaproteobacteria bacterium]|nr:hypothetical protein [Deltaproteobacteria bacterium]
MRARAPLFFALSTVVLLACSSKDEPGTKPASQQKPIAPEPIFWGPDCDPLVPWHCGFPFPSSTQLADDPSTPTKKRVAFKAGALPKWGNKDTAPSAFADNDGFSPSGTLVTYMWRATAAGLPTQDELQTSITTKSKTIVMEADTGALVPHWSEIDMLTPQDEDRDLMVRPVVRLKDATRYIVAIRDVVDPEGDVIPASPAFAALRDGTKFDHPSIEPRRKLYDDIFQKLENAGVPRKNLQIAWDFTTASKQNITQWLVSMRDDALKTVGEEGPEYRIVEVKDDADGVARRIEGMMKVPLYLDKPGPGGKLVLDPATKLPKQNGTAEFPFTVWIPKSATETPAPLLQNGHGLLGRRTEGGGGYLTGFASKYNYVAFAVDWVGMSSDDRGFITDTIVTDIGGFRTVVDRQHQGHINKLLAMRMMKGRFKNDPNVQFGGKSAIDPTQGCFYRGDSQGGIFGGVYMTISTDVTRGLLSVPGAPYSILLDRSVDFTPFHFLLGMPYSSDKDMPIVQGLVQMLWDRTEPGGYLSYLTKDLLPGTPRHDVLLHVAIGDFQVTPLGAHWMARTIGDTAKLMTPAARPVWGIPEQAYPFEGGSGLIEFDTNTAEAPKTNIPPEKSGDDPHGVIRKLNAAQKMADTFFRTGKIVATCDGKCDPE